MDEDRNQERSPKQAKQTHPPDWQPNLNPNHLSGQDARQQSDARVEAEWAAFHLRKRGMDPGGVNDEELHQAPIVSEGEPLQPK